MKHPGRPGVLIHLHQPQKPQEMAVLRMRLSPKEGFRSAGDAIRVRRGS
jgi:hypothetical protein